MSLVPTAAQIRAQVSAVLEKIAQAQVIGIKAPLSVEIADSLRIGETELPVARCDSVLEIRERMEDVAEQGTPMVLLTPLGEAELGADVVARLARRQLFPIEPWQLVKDCFRARFVDPRLVQHHPWVARALLEAEPAGGYPPAPSGFIQAELVWDVLFESLLGLASGERDAEAIVEWSLDAERRERASRLDAEIASSLGAAIEGAGGAAARTVLEYATGEHGESTLGVGLVARVLYDPAARADKAATKAMGKLEARLGSRELEFEVALAWASAAEAVASRQLARRPMNEVRPLLEQADKLLTELGAAAGAHRSRYLPSGYEQRLETFANALQRVVSGGSEAALEALQEAMEAVLAHALAAHEPQQVLGIEMAGRLARWLVLEAKQPASAGSLGAAARAYRGSGGYVDWARARVWEAHALATSGKAYAALLEAVGAVREAENRRFGALLANWVGTGSHDHSVVGVEHFIERIVAPLAQRQPLLLVVVDGMGMAVFRELQSDLIGRGWVEIDTAAASLRLPVIAALPTVTEVSRTSLLCGALTVGHAGSEKEGFSTHPALVTIGSRPKLPILYHKGDLSGADSGALAPAVLGAVADLQRRVVGVVINAVDDHLAKGDQLRVDWTVHRIRPLEELLSAARDAGRALILVSDHGYIAEHNTTGRGAGEAERWREATGAPLDDEVLLKGQRVVRGQGHSIIAPWSERVRFSAKKNGYHGGAAPQEVVIPLGIFAPAGVAFEGWVEAPSELPAWWEPEPAAAPVVVPAAKRVKPKPPMVPDEQGRLFPTEQETAAAAHSDWIEGLMASALMVEQRRLAARVALPEDRIRAMLLALDERGGKLTRAALAKRLGVPPLRLAGMLSALRRLLNVDGYAALSVDEASDTVELNRRQLFTQFGL